ncbi:hypothetical protein [Thioalkalivibrio sp. HK1]|uniref:hypothetical protein n=1 Tax=Thioalkalivibrio sp. HK1 TaxID=1469245 RepID=UPI0012DDB53B|nr:hypothetical protein [Thioalkalivibrio sp. HK1]
MPKMTKKAIGQFPMMQPGSIDYIDGEYNVDIESDIDTSSIRVQHRVTGENLVSKYIQEGKAVFATEVVSPHSTYRKIFKHEGSLRASLNVEQKVNIEKEKVIDPFYYRPLVVIKESVSNENEKINLQREHGVHELFYGQDMPILPGMILAKDNFWNPSEYKMSLFQIAEEKSLRKGSFEVMGIPEKGYYFRVEFASDIYQIMINKQGGQYDLKKTILTFALSEGLSIVYRESLVDEEKWKEFPALRILHDMIVKEGLNAWDGEKFNPGKIATTLCPIDGVMRND